MAQVGVVEGRHVAVDDQVAVEPDRPHLAHRLRHLALHVPEQRDGEAIGEGGVEFAGDQRQDRGRQVLDDRILDTVEKRAALLPVIEVSRHLDEFVRLEPGEIETAGADRVLAHLARRDVAGVDRRKPAGESRQKCRLRLLQLEGDLVGRRLW